MTWEPTDEIAFCPACGAKGSIDVEPSRDDYYLGPIFRCRECREGFYHSPADPSPIVVRGEEPAWVETMRVTARSCLNTGSSIFLAELERKPSGGKVRVPLHRGPVDESPGDL